MPRNIDWRRGLPTWLPGKHATVTTPGCTASGVVERAAAGRFGQPFVEFENGDSIDWYHDDQNVTVVCDVEEGQP